MPRDIRAAANKRARERAQQERNKEKQQRRLDARERRGNAAAGGGEDPDIAGITPGPQPKPDWLEELDDEAPAEAEDAQQQ